MKDKLVIVESPTKAKTIGKILGDDFSVVSSMGHLIDLPKKKLGVDIENDFAPEYVTIVGRQKVLDALKKESKGKKTIFVATDPDREGEAIGWHIKNRLFKNKKFLRVIFHEITPAAVSEAFKNPRDFDQNMIEAQASRRILDRIVGYFLSPLLWRKIARGLSAGRVQSVALRLIAEREKQINNFISQEYWEIEAELKKLASPVRNNDGGYERVISNGASLPVSQSLDFARDGSRDGELVEPFASSFVAKLEKIEDKKAEIKNKIEADRLLVDIKNKQFIVSEIKKTEKKRYPSAPFITSTLQQEAFNKLRFNATKTMIIAQQLYEGIDINQEGPVGVITYMRADSTRVAPEAIKEVREHIDKNFGKKYLPQTPNVYKVKKLAQEAHEAIRPTLISRAPENLKEFLSRDQYKLYELIYNRFIASQMTPAEYLVTTVDINAARYLFVVSGSELIFDGFMAVYPVRNLALRGAQNDISNGVYNKNNDDEENTKEKKNVIPPLEKGEILALIQLIPSQHFTKSPPRFSDSSLVKALEEDGIGRPSTYAPIIQTLILRDYIRRLKGYFYPTELGIKVCDLLVEYFPKIMDVNFTALMEEELDEVEEGRLDRLKVLQDFYAPFKTSLDFAQTHIKKEVIKTDEVCDKCGEPMIIKWGRKGKFLSCSDFPKCKNSKSITSGVKCPEPACGGELIERRSRRGFFYGCSNYPKCKFTSKTLPQDKE